MNKNDKKRKPNGYWNCETCYQEAQKYKSRTKFARSNQRAYQVALKNGWLNDYNWFIHSKS